jgi:hypothetical protein
MVCLRAILAGIIAYIRDVPRLGRIGKFIFRMISFDLRHDRRSICVMIGGGSPKQKGRAGCPGAAF